jgi:acylphosphatase
VTTARTFRVDGRVQGVGFRWAAREEATRLGLGGWVRNDDDGAVSGWFEGDPEAVEAFAVWLTRGPRGAWVDELSVRDAEVRGMRLFSIRP